jgi:hypothetical protein
MIRTFAQVSLLALCGAFAVGTCLAQNPAPAPSPGSSTTPAAGPSQPQDTSSTAPADPKKPKKVWTNEDVGNLSGPVSVVGNSKNLGKPGGEGKADGQYIANTKKELAKLQSQLDDADKQLADLKEFSEGKPPATSSGYQINKGYNRMPVDQQITSLEDKRKQTQTKIDALLDEARKKGVEPGQLR